MPGGNEYLFIFYSGLLTDCKPRKVSKQEVMTGLQDGWDISKFMEVLERPLNQRERRVRSKVYSHTRKHRTLSKKGSSIFPEQGPEKGPQSISRWPLAAPDRKRISRSFTGSSNRDVSLRSLDSHYNYAYRDRRSEKTWLYLGIAPGVPGLFLVVPLAFFTAPFVSKRRRTSWYRSSEVGEEEVLTFWAPQAVWHTHWQLYYRVPSHRVLLPNPVFLQSRLSSRSPVFSTP